MLRLADDVKVYLHREPVDLRAGIDSLAILVEQTMQLDSWSRSIFAFCNRQRDRMKLLFFDRQGVYPGFEAARSRQVPVASQGASSADADDGTASLASGRHRH